LQFKRKSKRATSANKIIIDKKEVKNDAKEARKIEVEAKRIKLDAKLDAKANAKATTTTTTITITITNKKQLLRLREQFVCTYVNLVFEIISILLSCLLLFDNLQKYTSNTLYS